jgi:preprotein translocase subunit SecA
LEATCKEKITAHLTTLKAEADRQLRSDTNPYPINEVITMLNLRSIDLFWVEHLETLQYLRTGIGLRGYGQRDPVVEYKRESKDLFNRLLADIRHQFVGSLMNIVLTPAARQMTPHEHEPLRLQEKKTNLKAFETDEEPVQQTIESKPKDATGHKIGRNDPCYCGSGKKFKKCHGAE